MSADHLSEMALRGWTVFEKDDRLVAWIANALPAAMAALKDASNERWWRSGGTWFVGVNVLGNDDTGRLPKGAPLEGAALDFIAKHAGPVSWDAGQVSVIREGYPRQGTESDAAFAFRKTRDAAHLDGLKREGSDNRRFLGEYHRFLLGIPMLRADRTASPLVVWDGSHRVLQTMLKDALGGLAEEEWSDVDLTEIYAQTRRKIFETCERQIVHASPGQAYLVHRHSLHGISPWQSGAMADPTGRMVAYFRPETKDRQAWLSDSVIV